MTIPNSSRTCEANSYCRINRTKLRQTGKGRRLSCPRCGTIYDPDEGREKQIAEEELDAQIDEYLEQYKWYI